MEVNLKYTWDTGRVKLPYGIRHMEKLRFTNVY